MAKLDKSKDGMLWDTLGMQIELSVGASFNHFAAHPALAKYRALTKYIRSSDGRTTRGHLWGNKKTIKAYKESEEYENDTE